MMKPIYTAIAGALLLLSPGCRPAQAQGPKTFDVTQAPYNADSTGKTDAAPAINHAVSDAVTYGNANNVAVTVSLPAGTYFLQSGPINVSNAKSPFTLTGQSSDTTFLTYTRTQNNQVLFMSGNTTPSLIVENFTEDANSPSELNFTQGTIIALDKTAKPYPTITVQAEAGYPLMSSPQILSATNQDSSGHYNFQTVPLYTFSDPKRPIWDNYLANMRTITPSADGTTAVLGVDRIPSIDYVGEAWVILGATPSYPKNIATTCQYNNSTTLQNINYYGGVDCTDDGAGTYNNVSVTFVNYYQGPPPAVSQPGRPARFLPDRRVTTIEGFQLGGRGTFSFTNCDMSGGWDDVLDIGGNSAQSIAQISPAQVHIDGTGQDYRVGDTVEFAPPNYGAVYATTTITSIANYADSQGKQDGSLILTLHDPITLQNTGSGGYGSSGDFCTDLTAAGPIVLKNSAFSAQFGHLFIKSGVSILVDGCRLHDMSDTGVEVVGSEYYHQGPFTAHNVTIQNSLFTNCQHQSIHIGDGTAPNGSNVKILNNTFRDTTSWSFGDPKDDSGIGTAVQIESVNGLTLSGNTFERNWGANIGAQYDANITIQNNTFNHPNFIRPAYAARYSGKNPDPSAVIWLSSDAAVSLSGNIVNGAGPYTKSLVEVKTNVTGATGLTNGVTQIDYPLAFSLAQ